MSGVWQDLDSRAPLFDGRPREIAVGGENGLLRLGAFARCLDLGFGHFVWTAAHVGDGVVQPPDLRVFASNHVLVRVVDLIVPDVTGGGDVPLSQAEFVPVKLPQELQQFGRLHELCFSLQVMQTRVHGIAFSRAGAIGSPQSRHTP